MHAFICVYVCTLSSKELSSFSVVVQLNISNLIINYFYVLSLDMRMIATLEARGGDHSIYLVA